jgi:hypothetical protein
MSYEMGREGQRLDATGHQSMIRRHDQIALIMENVKTPFNDSGVNFVKMTRAWVR